MANSDNDRNRKYEPDDRRDHTQEFRGDRRRGGWREFRQNYPGFVFTLLFALIVMLSVDGLLLFKRRAYAGEVARLQGSMSETERAKTNAIIEAEQNKTRIAIELARRQAKLEKTLHLSISLDSGKFYLERDGAVLREMPIAFGPETMVGSEAIPIVIPRGERSLLKADSEGITLDGGANLRPTSATSLADDKAPIMPGGLRIRRVDLDAILPNLTPGMRVFFY
jgi:hypothetical protein